MNAKLKYFYDHYNSSSESDLNEIRCYMLFNKADNDLRNQCLDLLPRHDKLKFLETWAIGLTFSENDYETISNELEELFTHNREVGGKLLAEEFIRNNQDKEYIDSFKILLDASPINSIEENFANTHYQTANDIYSIIKNEDSLVISIVLDQMDKNSVNLNISKKLRVMFGELPKPLSEVSHSTLREIERVLERKLSALEER